MTPEIKHDIIAIANLLILTTEKFEQLIDKLAEDEKQNDMKALASSVSSDDVLDNYFIEDGK